MSKFNELLFLYTLSAVIISTLTVTSTSFCEVPDRKLSFLYNLTKLSSNKEDTIIKHDYPNEIIRMQLCSPLIKKCNNQDGYAICLIKNNTEKGIGKFPPQINNDLGKILFSFTGGNCLFDIKYTVQIIIRCDYGAEDNSYPELFPHEDTQCNLFMIWKTALACGKRFQTNCTVVHKGYHYDLSPLTRSSENYVIHIKNGMNSPKIVLNVCQSVIRQYGAMCPIKSGACLDDPKNPNRYLSLGEVQKPPFFDDFDTLRIEYQDGMICRNSIQTPSVKTTIIFLCTLDGSETLPQYQETEDNCHYNFLWFTAAACSVESLRKYSEKIAGNCSVTNPITNFTYNLQLLMFKDFTVINTSGRKYTFRVCTPVMHTESCEVPGTGICDSKTSKSLGRANGNLIWQQGGPYLNYTRGNLCKKGMYHYTVIGFFCGPEGSSNQPLLMEDNLCQTVIHWNTDLACEKRIKCTTNNDDEIDLTPLIQSTNNYIVKANGSEFHINICRPLVPTRGLTCTHGSAACKVLVTSENEYINEISLGFPMDSPTLNKDLQIILRYIGGSQCPENPLESISSNFTFICDNNNQGVPVYKTYVNCTYVFEWNTSIACGAVIGGWTPPCIIKDSFLSYEYDLSLLYKKEQVHYVKGKQGKEYTINICGGKKYCNGSAVCHGGDGYGSLKSVIFDYSRNDVKLKYSNGSECNNNFYTSEIRFICNDSIGIGAPKLLLELQCSVEFEWHTEIICAKHAKSRNADRENVPCSEIQLVSSSHGKHAGAIAGIVLTVSIVLAILIYFRNPEKRACFYSWINWLSFRRNANRVQYCKVNTTEEARLLFDASDPTECQTDSDDDDDLLHA